MNNFEYLKSLSIPDFAYSVCFDICGDCRGVCAICQRHIEGDCDDKCYAGVCDFLKNEVENGNN